MPHPAPGRSNTGRRPAAGSTLPAGPAPQPHQQEPPPPVVSIFELLDARAPRQPLPPKRPPAPRPAPPAPQTSGHTFCAHFKGSTRLILAQMHAQAPPAGNTAAALWRLAAPPLAHSLLQPPYALKDVLQELERADYDDARRSLARELACHLGAAPCEAWPRRLVLEEAVLIWTQQRYPDETCLPRQQERIFVQLGTVEARRDARQALPEDEQPQMRHDLGALLYRAKRFDQSRCIANKTPVFASALAFAGLHLAVASALGAASAAAWCVGAPGCWEFALVFVGCATGVLLVSVAFYVVLWLYHRYAPWETGTRDADLTPPQLAATKPAAPTERVSRPASPQLPQRRSDGG